MTAENLDTIIQSFPFVISCAIFFLAALIIVIYVVKHKSKNKRKQALAGWAFSRDLSFADANNSGIEDRYPYFKCLQKGNHRYGYNIIEGNVDNRKICAFDYHYDISDGKNRHDYYFSAVVLDAELPLKPLFVRDENFLDKVADFFGADDIKFESIEFNSQFHVKSSDKKWAYDVLNQATMEFLMGSPRFYLDFHDRYVIAYRKSTFTVAEFEDAIQVITGILDRLPESLLQELQIKK